MKIIGAIQAFNEEDKIAGAITSLFNVGCDRVVVLDGAWLLPDGRPFGSGEVLSSDDTRGAATRAGAEFVLPSEPMYGDGGKRDLLIRSLDAQEGDKIFILDADERIEGQLNRNDLPPTHACVMLRNLRENDLPEFRGTWPRGDYGPILPLIRWLTWSPLLRCDGAGRYRRGHYPIEPYLLGALRQLEQLVGWDGAIGRASQVISEVMETLTPEQACNLPILSGVEILHIVEATEERKAAKLAYYQTLRGE